MFFTPISNQYHNSAYRPYNSSFKKLKENHNFSNNLNYQSVAFKGNTQSFLVSNLGKDTKDLRLMQNVNPEQIKSAVNEAASTMINEAKTLIANARLRVEKVLTENNAEVLIPWRNIKTSENIKKFYIFGGGEQGYRFKNEKYPEMEFEIGFLCGPYPQLSSYKDEKIGHYMGGETEIESLTKKFFSKRIIITIN